MTTESLYQISDMNRWFSCLRKPVLQIYLSDNVLLPLPFDDQIKEVTAIFDTIFVSVLTTSDQIKTISVVSLIHWAWKSKKSMENFDVDKS